jgi:hypothetical protein
MPVPCLLALQGVPKTALRLCGAKMGCLWSAETLEKVEV